jgi:hypothetical protein
LEKDAEDLEDRSSTPPAAALNEPISFFGNSRSGDQTTRCQSALILTIPASSKNNVLSGIPERHSQKKSFRLVERRSVTTHVATRSSG